VKLTEEEKLTLQSFKNNLIEKMGNAFVELKLFGSKARGDARKDSDIDVLVVVKSEDWRISDMVYEIVTDILIDNGISISPKVISLKTFKAQKKKGISFIKNVIRDGATV